MKKITALILLAAFTVSLAGCQNDNPGSASGDTAVVCYEDYPSVPDYGALCGYEQYSKTQYEELTLYSYEAKEPGQTGETVFKNNYEAFVSAAKSLGSHTDEQYWEDELVCRVSCGDELVYISRVANEYNGEILTLLIVAIGSPEAFTAYQ